jgi:hypothetical protein
MVRCSLFAEANLSVQSGLIDLRVVFHQSDRPTISSDRDSCYKFEMPKSIEKWLLFTYVDGEFTPLSRPFKTTQLAEKARSTYPEQERRKIGVGVIRIEN